MKEGLSCFAGLLQMKCISTTCRSLGTEVIRKEAIHADQRSI